MFPEFAEGLSFAPTIVTACGGVALLGRVMILRRRLAREIAAREAVEQRFTAALAVNPMVVFCLDAELRYTWVHNNQIGAADQSVVGCTPFDVFAPDSAQRLHAFFAEVLHGGTPRRRELRLTNAAGVTKHFASAARPLHGPDGSVCGITGASIDISQVIERERALADARASAEEARIVAERANSAKSTFLAAASHDLRQPFQAMRLFHQVLEQKAPPGLAPIVDNLGHAMTSGEELLNAILDLSVLDSGTVAPKPTAFAIDAMLDEIASECRAVAEAGQLRLRRVRCGATITTDRVLLKRMVRNLVLNSVRYTRQGGILLGCRRRAGGLEIQVVDTGIGIPEEARERIFDDFYQIGNPARDRNQGLGLGLAIVTRLSRLLNLPVTVASAPGKGTSFSIFIAAVDYSHKNNQFHNWRALS